MRASVKNTLSKKTEGFTKKKVMTLKYLQALLYLVNLYRYIIIIINYYRRHKVNVKNIIHFYLLNN